MGTRQRFTSVAVAGFVGCAIGIGPAQAQLPFTEPAPAPERARIAFEFDGGIHTIAADGSDRRKVTDRGKRTFDEEPAWSPDGATIAFARQNLQDETLAIWLVNRDGSGLRRLTPDAPITESGPTWSPDGARIAFSTHDYDERRDRVTASLVSVRADGSDRQVVHSETGRAIVFFADPAWSPKGDQILFTRHVFGDDFFEDSPAPELLATPAAPGGGARRLVAGAEDGEWSPSGDRIAFTSRHERDSGLRRCTQFCDGAGEIYAANADGSGRVRLTTSRAHDREPSWSGDGRWIAFASDRNTAQAAQEESPPELYSMRPDGSCVTWLTNGTAHSETPGFERNTGLNGDPGGCGAVPREPLVDTGLPARFDRRWPTWWFGKVAPNGLLLTDVGSDGHSLWFVYGDCGRFDPEECGEFVNVDSMDLCRVGGLRGAGRPNTTLSLVRGALLEEHKDERDGIGRSVIYTHRSRVVMDTASGYAVDRSLIPHLRRFPSEESGAANLPSTRLPAHILRGVRASSRVSKREADRRRAVRRRLAQLGVKRRLGC